MRTEYAPSSLSRSRGESRQYSFLENADPHEIERVTRTFDTLLNYDGRVTFALNIFNPKKSPNHDRNCPLDDDSIEEITAHFSSDADLQEATQKLASEEEEKKDVRLHLPSGADDHTLEIQFTTPIKPESLLAAAQKNADLSQALIEDIVETIVQSAKEDPVKYTPENKPSSKVQAATQQELIEKYETKEKQFKEWVIGAVQNFFTIASTIGISQETTRLLADQIYKGTNSEYQPLLQQIITKNTKSFSPDKKLNP